MRGGFGLVLRLLLLCFVVGFVLTFFDIRPETLFTDTLRTIERVFGELGDIVHWAGRYVLLGAVVVVPIALVLYLLRSFGRRL